MGLYEDGEPLSRWDKLVKEADPDYGHRLYQILKSSQILPPPEKLNGFVFLSVSSNGASREAGLASEIDRSVSGIEFQSKPKIIANDIAVIKNPTKIKLDNVEFVRIQSDAYSLPTTKESVDVIYDRMGALWYRVHQELESATLVNGKLPEWSRSEITESIKQVLTQYTEKLKIGGHILIDNPDRISKDPMSTTQYLQEIIPDMKDFLSEIGLECQNIGEKEDRLMVISVSK